MGICPLYTAINTNNLSSYRVDMLYIFKTIKEESKESKTAQTTLQKDKT